MPNRPREILDACCGGRMWWWDKAHPLAVYVDCREEPRGAHPARPNWHLSPDVLGDFRALPFDDEAFQLVLFDPPHNVRENPSGIYSLYYGALSPETEQDDLRRGFAECWRVLAPGGTLVFKWAGKVDRVKPALPSDAHCGHALKPDVRRSGYALVHLLQAASRVGNRGGGVMTRCPLDGKPLVARERVRVETVPSTVPDYLTRDQQAKYRRVEHYEIVSCSNRHEFRRTNCSLRGMRAE